MWPRKPKGPILWEIEIHFYNWWALKLCVKWMWTMLRDRNICSGLGPHHGNIIFFKTRWQFYWLLGPLALREFHLFLMGPMQYPKNHEKLCTCCHVGRQVHFSPIQISESIRPSRSSTKWPWTISNFLTNHIICKSWIKCFQAPTWSDP